MKFEKRLVLGIILIAGFVFIVSFSTLYAETHIVEGTAYTCTLPIPVLIPTLSSLGIFVGSIVYYLMFSRILESERKNEQDINILLEMLQPDEREVIKKLIENKGIITQSRLSSLFGKVRTFRVLENLRKRGIIIKKKYGKTNKIEFSEKFKRILS
jgi:chromosome condensin MukBEF MukE localization factor